MQSVEKGRLGSTEDKRGVSCRSRHALIVLARVPGASCISSSQSVRGNPRRNTLREKISREPGGATAATEHEVRDSP